VLSETRVLIYFRTLMAPIQPQPVTLFLRNTDDGRRGWISTKPNNSPLNIPSSDKTALKESKVKRVAH